MLGKGTWYTCQRELEPEFMLCTKSSKQISDLNVRAQTAETVTRSMEGICELGFGIRFLRCFAQETEVEIDYTSSK